MPLTKLFSINRQLYLWDCRRSQLLPSLAGFKIKVKIKFVTEKYICTKNKTLNRFNKKMGNILSYVICHVYVSYHLGNFIMQHK